MNASKSKKAVVVPTTEAAPVPTTEMTLAEKRSAGVAKSWKDPIVRQKRLTRHAVRVNGQDFRSVYEAFRALRLPISKHIPFRGKLKATGKLDFDGITFEIVEAEIE